MCLVKAGVGVLAMLIVPSEILLWDVSYLHACRMWGGVTRVSCHHGGFVKMVSPLLTGLHNRFVFCLFSGLRSPYVRWQSPS